MQKPEEIKKQENENFENYSIDQLLLMKEQYQKGRNNEIKIKIRSVFSTALIITTLYSGVNYAFKERLTMPIIPGSNIGIEKVYKSNKTILNEKGSKVTSEPIVTKGDQDSLFYISDLREKPTTGYKYYEVYSVAIDHTNKDGEFIDYEKLIKDRSQMEAIFSQSFDLKAIRSNSYQSNSLTTRDSSETDDYNNNRMFGSVGALNAGGDSFGIISYEKAEEGQWRRITRYDSDDELYKVIFILGISFSSIGGIFSIAPFSKNKKYNKVSRKQYKEVCRTLKQR